MKNIFALHQICDFRSGTSTGVSSIGDVPCVQGRDFNADGQYVNREIQFAPSSALKYAHYLKPGDILFSTKGKIFTAVWHNQVPNAIASGTFIILLLKVDFVLPEYLSLYLNSAKAKRYFDLHTKAATVIHIGKKDIELLEIEIPDLKKQNAIICAWKLLMEEKAITKQMIEKKEKLIEHLL